MATPRVLETFSCCWVTAQSSSFSEPRTHPHDFPHSLEAAQTEQDEEAEYKTIRIEKWDLNLYAHITKSFQM